MVLGSELARAPRTALSFPHFFKLPGMLENSPEITEFGPVCSLPCLTRGPGDDKQRGEEPRGPGLRGTPGIVPGPQFPVGSTCPGVLTAPCPRSHPARPLGCQPAAGSPGPESLPPQKTQTLILSVRQIHRREEGEQGERCLEGGGSQTLSSSPFLCPEFLCYSLGESSFRPVSTPKGGSAHFARLLASLPRGSLPPKKTTLSRDRSRARAGCRGGAPSPGWLRTPQEGLTSCLHQEGTLSWGVEGVTAPLSSSQTSGFLLRYS